jgi:hypothetical protein
MTCRENISAAAGEKEEEEGDGERASVMMFGFD